MNDPLGVLRADPSVHGADRRLAAFAHVLSVIENTNSADHIGHPMPKLIASQMSRITAAMIHDRKVTS